MKKFHINSETGDIGPCRATQDGCPFGGVAQHYASLENAQLAFELSMGSPLQAKAKKIVRTALNFEEAETRNSIALPRIDRIVSKPLTPAEKTVVILNLYEAHFAVGRHDDSFTAAEKLAEEFERRAAGRPEITEDIIYAVKGSAFTFVSPHVDKASRAFEDELAKAGWETRSSHNTSVIDFERRFTEAARQAGPNFTPEKLEETFVAVVQADKTWSFEDDEEGRATIRVAAKAAAREIQKDKEAFVKEMKLLP